MKVWQIVGVVALGMLVGTLFPGRFAQTLAPATLYLFLPALLFEAAWQLDVQAARKMWLPIAVLAVPVVVATATVVAALLVMLGLPAGPAFLVGAMLSATDPIAVVAVMRRAGVAPALAATLECESLFNDAVGVVLYGMALSAATVQAANAGTFAEIALRGVAGAVAGIALGVALAWIAALLLRPSVTRLPQIAATLALAYGSYFIAARLSLSGIFASIAAGIALNAFERARLTRSIDQDVDRVWHFFAIGADVIVFALLGGALAPALIAPDVRVIVVAAAAVIGARLLTAAGFRLAGWPAAWASLLQAAGMRGALSAALAIALPVAVVQRQTIAAAVFVTVLATIALAGVTLGDAAKRAAR